MSHQSQRRLQPEVRTKTDGTPAKRPSPWIEWKISAIRTGSAFRVRFGRKGGCRNVRGGIGDARVHKGLSSFDTGSASAAVENAAFVAGPSAGVVDFQFCSATNDGGFVHGNERAQELNFRVGSFFHGF